MVQNSDIPDYDRFRQDGVYRIRLSEPHVALKKQVEDSASNPFPTPSGRSKSTPAVGGPAEGQPSAHSRYIETWESRNDPLAKKYPLQLISAHCKRRANGQFETIPWLKELQEQELLINTGDARVRGIKNGDTVRVFNDRGEIALPARVTERIMPGVVDVPAGAWYNADEKGVDRELVPMWLTRDTYSPGGSIPYNTCLVEVRKD